MKSLSRLRCGAHFLSSVFVASILLHSGTAGAVGNGQPDGQANVGRITWPGVRACSGELITPVWFLTARHCIVGANPTFNAIGYITFQATSDFPSPIPPAWGTGSDVANRHAVTSLPAYPLYGRYSTVNPDDPDDRATDLAFVQLAARMPMVMIPPLHPPLAECPHDDVTMNIIGYGPTTVNGNFPPGYTGQPYRNSAQSPHWNFIATNDFAYYKANFSGAFYGSEPGDSGGALVFTEASGARRLCGSVSGHTD